LSLSIAYARDENKNIIAEIINEKGDLVNDRRNELKEREDVLIILKTKTNDKAMLLEKFSNFFKKASRTIKSNGIIHLLDQLIRNVL